MGKLRKTLFLSEMKETKNNTRFKFQAPYIFQDHNTATKKWREDTWYFDNPELVRKEAELRGYKIA